MLSSHKDEAIRVKAIKLLDSNQLSRRADVVFKFWPLKSAGKEME